MTGVKESKSKYATRGKDKYNGNKFKVNRKWKKRRIQKRQI